MEETFDLTLHSLAGRSVIGGNVTGESASALPPSTTEPSRAPRTAPCVTGAQDGATFFLETFGCQMNDHDSEKVAGVLLSRGYRQGEKSGRASHALYTTHR